jgi:hypothetical protein
VSFLLLDSNYDVEGEMTYSWNIATLVEREFTYIWNAYGAIVAEITYKWNIAAYLEKEWTFKWNIVAYLERDFAFLWNVYDSAASIGRKAKYTFKVPAAVNRFYRMFRA